MGVGFQVFGAGFRCTRNREVLTCLGPRLDRLGWVGP